MKKNKVRKRERKTDMTKEKVKKKSRENTSDYLIVSAIYLPLTF